MKPVANYWVWKKLWNKHHRSSSPAAAFLSNINFPFLSHCPSQLLSLAVTLRQLWMWHLTQQPFCGWILIKSQIDRYGVPLGDKKGWTGQSVTVLLILKSMSCHNPPMSHDDTDSKNPLSSSFVFCEMLTVQKPHSSIAQSKYETKCKKQKSPFLCTYWFWAVKTLFFSPMSFLQPTWYW